MERAEQDLETARKVIEVQGDVSALPGVPASTIAELGRTERLPSVKLGSRRLFHLPAVSGALMDAMQSGRQL